MVGGCACLARTLCNLRPRLLGCGWACGSCYFLPANECRRLTCPLFLLRIRGGATVTTFMTTAYGSEPSFSIQPVGAAGFGIGGCILRRASGAPSPTAALPQLWMKRRELLRRAGPRMVPRAACAQVSMTCVPESKGEGSTLNGRRLCVTTHGYLLLALALLVAFLQTGADPTFHCDLAANIAKIAKI